MQPKIQAIMQIRGLANASVDLSDWAEYLGQSRRLRNKNVPLFFFLSFAFFVPELALGELAVFLKLLQLADIRGSSHFAPPSALNMQFLHWGALSTVLVGLIYPGFTVAVDANSRAQIALNALQNWYNATSGLWDTCGWWNGANCLTVVADLAAIDPSVLDTATYVFGNTLQNAPAYNPQPGPEVQVQSRYEGDAANASEWMDSAYDDDAWWALAWIAAYDVTTDDTYLSLAQDIFSNLTKAWGTRCGGGGLQWSTTSSYINAITNELFLSVAAHLANRASDSERETYVGWAQKQWDWFAAQDFIGSNYTINDGLLENCQNNGQTVWSYNQGVILGGLVELNRAAPNDTYLESANKIAQGAINTLCDANMVIHDVCEPNCAPDATQFKGIFIRNLQMLQQDSPNDIYKNVIEACANSIWENDRNDQNQLGVNWAGPFSSADASTHSSALDALVAAIAV
ncbi:hypothetical protein PMG11_03466 [Penicillium brasilianum]|uniref:Glycosyl hydrolase n=1 Tax=Penicillium brasilianum TaxID=104259 RepID=A0A0F7VHI5_PENBI|nr:hypothetical protein PMG11_03466 [Penicillium brasilianum]